MLDRRASTDTHTFVFHGIDTVANAAASGEVVVLRCFLVCFVGTATGDFCMKRKREGAFSALSSWMVTVPFTFSETALAASLTFCMMICFAWNSSGRSTIVISLEN